MITRWLSISDTLIQERLGTRHSPVEASRRISNIGSNRVCLYDIVRQGSSGALIGSRWGSNVDCSGALETGLMKR